MAEITPTITYYAYLGGEWVELDVASDTITARQGILDNHPLARIADVGELNLTLLNEDNKYTPGHSNCLDGWKAGVKIKEEIKFTDADLGECTRNAIFYVAHDGIELDLKPLGTRKAKVRAYDWMDFAYRKKIKNTSSQSNKRADELIDAVVSAMDNQPANTDYDEGVSTFPTVLDVTNENTKVYNILAQAALSEWGRVYIRPDETDGETLVFENLLHRTGIAQLTRKPDTGLTKFTTVFNVDAFYNIPPIDLYPSYGRNTQNAITARAYPRKVDASTVTLFTLSEPLAIASGKSITVEGYYTNPNGGKRCNGTDMVTPVSSTDYTGNAASDGSGTDYTADLSVDDNYYSDRFSHTITNGAAVTVWLTKLNCRGKGVYIDDAIEYSVQHDDSIDQSGEAALLIPQKYQRDLVTGRMIADTILEIDHEPETRIDAVSFWANQNKSAMISFIYFHAGDLIQIGRTDTGKSRYYYINGVEHEITAGKVIKVLYHVEEVLSIRSERGLQNAGMIFSSTGATDAVDYGYVPYLANLPEITFRAWVYTHAFSGEQCIASMYGDAPGWQIYIDDIGRVVLKYGWSNGTDAWRTDDVVITVKTWHHVAFTRVVDSSTTAPIIYIDGDAVDITRIAGSDSGTLVDQTDNRLMIGNIKTATYDYSSPFNGWIQNMAIWREVFAAGNIAADYGYGKDDTDPWENVDYGFWGAHVKVSKASDYDGVQALSAGRNLLETAYHRVGVGHGSVVPYTAITAPDYIKVLLHCEGADASNTITDETGKSWTASGNAQIDTAQHKFGSASLLLDGTGDYISTADHADFALANGDFQIDCWARWNTLPSAGQYQAFYAQYTDANNYSRFALRNNGGTYYLYFQVRESGTIAELIERELTAPSTGTWYHVCLSRVDDDFRMFWNGEQVGATETASVTFSDLSGSVYIGQSGGNAMYLNGWIDEFRFRKGIGISADFTPPASPYGY